MSRSYRKTLIQFTAAALMPLILLGSIFAWLTYRDVTEELRKNSEGMLSQIAEENDIIFNELNSIFLTLSTNQRLTGLLSDLLKSGRMSYADSIQYHTMKSILYSQTHSRPYIHSIYIAMEDAPQRFFSSVDGVEERATFYDTTWDQDISFSENSDITMRRRFISGSRNVPGTEVLSIYRKFSFGSKSHSGIIVLNLNMQMLNRTLRSPDESAASDVLAEYNGKVLFESSVSAAQRWNEHLDDMHDCGEFFTYKANGERYAVVRAESQRYGISYYKFVSERELYRVPYAIIRISICCAAVLLLMSFVTMTIISRRQYERLNKVLSILREESDKQRVTMSEKNYDEFEYIARCIQDNRILQKYFETELSEKAYKQKYTELTALQAQINPHMLYNTLETIRWKAFRLTDKENEVTMMLETLSALLKYSLNPATSFVSLGEEIDNTVNYIRLVKLRYPEQFKIIWDYSEEVMNYESMRLILQPVIENAIHHGARQNANGMTLIRIRITCVNDRIKIRILNTGVGMTKEQLEKVRSTLDLEFAPAKGMGLYNINKRLQLQYATQLEIHSKPGLGTVVAFGFPAKLYSEE